jgi:hypothetical protein
MDTSFLKNLSRDEIRANLIQHIHAINKKLSESFLQDLSDEDLCAEAHPAYRHDYERALGLDTKKVGAPILKITLE